MKTQSSGYAVANGVTRGVSVSEHNTEGSGGNAGSSAAINWFLRFCQLFLSSATAFSTVLPPLSCDIVSWRASAYLWCEREEVGRLDPSDHSPKAGYSGGLSSGGIAAHGVYLHHEVHKAFSRAACLSELPASPWPFGQSPFTPHAMNRKLRGKACLPEQASSRMLSTPCACSSVPCKSYSNGVERQGNEEDMFDDCCCHAASPAGSEKSESTLKHRASMFAAFVSGLSRNVFVSIGGNAMRCKGSQYTWHLVLLLLALVLCFGWERSAAEATDEKSAALPADCALFDPRSLLNYTIDAPDYFYRRRHEAPAHVAAARQLSGRRQSQASHQENSANGSESSTREVLSESQVFEFAVRRLQGIGGLFTSQRQQNFPAPGASEGGGRRRQQQHASLDAVDGGDSGGRGVRPLLESNGLICEDDERVEDFGVKCRLIARSLGGRLGCEKRLIDISPDGRLPANIPAFSRVADACPMTCGLCEECAPGCALWFLGNTLCDAVCNNAACQFDGGDCWSADCVVGPWAEWSACSVTCGGPGAQRRTREVKSRAKQGGSPCPKLEETRDGCNADVPCPNHCQVGPWEEWSACSQTCGPGISVRERTVLKEPDDEGQACPELHQERRCFLASCAADCAVSEWSDWSPCGAPCGGGQQTRQRHVLSVPVENGLECPTLVESRACNTFSCDGGCDVGQWGEWSECSKPCEGGTKTRTRSVKPLEDGADCPPSIQTAPCNLHDCAVDCLASEWGAWSTCNVPCGIGTQRRIREVIRAPKGAGDSCPPLDQLKPCDRGPCRVDCLLSEWTTWSECSHPCGLGEQRRTREVLELPTDRGSPCGSLEETRACGGHCDPKCILSDWTDWGLCTSLCQQAGATDPFTSRSRVVLLEAPDCPSSSSLTETQKCSALGFTCDIDCQLGTWSQWSPCSKPCGGGTRRRTREVTRVPQGNGKPCGELFEEGPCATTPCEALEGQAVADCVWGEWSPFGPCDATCGPGRRRSSRVVLAFPTDANGRPMQHLCSDSERFEACQGPPCPVDCQVTAWGEWTSCTVTCGGGQQQRQRSVVRHASNGGKECPTLLEVQPCGTYPCPADCEMSPWSEWSACSALCGEGQAFRTRRILSAASVDPPGLACGAVRQEASCFSPFGPCATDCALGPWSEWSECSALCGGGTRQRFRGVTEFEVGGGKPCTGNKEEAEACNLHACEAECRVSEWNEWTECSSPCAPADGSAATRSRYREILREPYPPGSRPCPPLEEVQKGCNADIPCPVDCSYTPWTSWGECMGECGIGHQERTRRILSEAKFGGEPCQLTEETADCSLEEPCVEDCVLGNWGEWGACSATCGGGYKRRQREVQTPPMNGGAPCDALEEFAPCAEFSCFGSDCEVSEWGEWGPCSKECGGGVHARERHVVSPRLGNGKECPELNQRRGCALHRCPGVACEDSSEVPLMTGVECKVLLAMGCHRRLQELAEENNQVFPDDLPPEVRISDACPKTCGVCAECAPGCQLRDLGNRHCDEACKNEACQMDLGDCGGDCPVAPLPPGLRAEPATSMLTEGQILVASCADSNKRLTTYTSLRQLAVTCTGKGSFAVEPPEVVLEMDDDGALLLPSCSPDPCPFIYVSGFTGDAVAFNGVFIRGDAHGSLPRFLQDTLGPDAHFLWAQELPQQGPRRKKQVVWRITHADPNSAATNSGLAAAATGSECAAELSTAEAAVGCTDTWEVGLAGANATSKPQKASFRCIDEDTKLALEAMQAEADEEVEEGDTGPVGPPKTIVAGVEMICEDQQEVQQKSGKTCEALKKMLKCDFLLADAGVELPSFLPPDATLALACPQTCGLCKQCSKGCPLWFLGNHHCDEACNVAACQFDRGDCGEPDEQEHSHHQAERPTAKAQDESGTETSVKQEQKGHPQQHQQEQPKDEVDPETDCEDDPQVKLMGFTCKVLYTVAGGTREGCNSRLLDLRPDEALPPGVPPVTRVKDACPKTCRACNDPDRLRRPGSRAADVSSCQDDPMVTEMGYSCKLLLAVAEDEGGGCEARLIDLKPDQTLPPGIPQQTRVKDACPKTCNACDDPTRLQRPSSPPGSQCSDFEFVSDAGSSCKLLVALAESQGLGGCAAPLSGLLEERHWPQGTPSDIALRDACPHTCDFCDGSVLMQMRAPVAVEASCLGGCCDNKMVEQETGYSCRQIKDFLNGACSVELESLSSAPLPPEVPKGATLRDACPFTCGACPAQQCVDNPLVEQMGYSCDMLIAAAEGRGGCEALLTSLSGEPLPVGVPPATRVRDACMKSCNACPPLVPGDTAATAVAGARGSSGATTATADCFDDGRLPQLGYSCVMLLDFASKGCETTLGELLPQSLSLPRHFHRHDMIKDFCPKTCGLCGGPGDGKREPAGGRRGCRNNPMVERAGLSCTLLVKASPLGCNAKLADLSDDPLPSGVPPSATVRDACMLDCGGCIDVPTCFDGFQNGDEEGIDCGGPCRACAACDPSPLKALGDGVLQEGRGTAHGATRKLSCHPDFVRVAGRNGEEVVCQDGTFSKPKLRCEPRSVNVQYIKANIKNAGDLQYGAVPAIFSALATALMVQPPDELRLLAVGLDRREGARGGSTECEDDPRVADMGYSCAVMEAFCDSKLHDLAAAQKKQLPEWLPKEARVKDACRKSCNACGNRRRLQAVSGSAPSMPLLIDAGVLWTRAAVPFSSLLTDDLPSRFLVALKQQFIRSGVTVVDSSDNSLVSAATALSSRPFLFIIESTEPRQLPATLWDRGFGFYSPPSHSKAVFAASGLPIPSSQQLELSHLLSSDGKKAAPPSYAAVDYSFGGEAPLRLPLPPGVDALRGACNDPQSARADANSCCGLQDELQGFVDGPCGALLYGKKITHQSVTSFCEKPVEGRYCWASFVARLDSYRHRTGAACSLLTAVEAVADAWCYKPNASSHSKYCFTAVEDALEAVDLRSLGTKSSSQLDEICGEQSCFRSNLRYLDSMTLLQTAWHLLHVPPGEAGFEEVDRTDSLTSAVERPSAAARARMLAGSTEAVGPGRRWLSSVSLRVQDAFDRTQAQMRDALSTVAHLTILQQPRDLMVRLPTEPFAASGSSPRRLSTLSRFQGPLTETLEEGLNLVCTRVDGDYCQQTLVLLAQESPIRTPSLLLEPCASRCFVPLTGAVGAIVEAYGERHRDPWHTLLGSVMRAYGRFYCVRNERGDFCGKHFFDRYKAVNPHKVAAQGLELPLPECKCPHSFLQDGQCDPECFNEACGWDGRDCLPSSMFGQLHAAVSSLVEPICSLYHPDFECGTKCFKQYETARAVGASGCCLGMGLDILGSVAAAEAAHPLGEIPWKYRRTVAFVEQVCGAAADRTCSLGQPRPLLHVELRVVGLNTQLTLKDAGKVDEVFGALRSALTRRLGLVDRDVTRHFARPDPSGITVELVLDAGREHALRAANLLRQPALVKELETSGLRQLGFVSLNAYIDQTKGILGVELVPDSIGEEQIVTPVAGLGPSPPKSGDEGLQELRLQIPPQPCSEAGLASIFPRYVTIKSKDSSDTGTPDALPVTCGAGYSPAKGSQSDNDQAVCDNGKWVIENGLDCRRTCTTLPQAILQPQGAYRLSVLELDSQYRAKAETSGSSQRAKGLAKEQGGATGSSSAVETRHGTAVFVSCADGYAAGRGQEGAWLKCTDGSWKLERSSFICHRVCPPFPELGSAFTVAGEGQNQGDERVVSCSRGFYPQRRTHRLVCLEGSWPVLPFTCSRAITPDLREGVAGFQKILQQMFSREGIMGFIVFSILVLAAALIVILCWLFRCRGRAYRQQRERAEALQALKLAGVPMAELAAVARARLGLSTGSVATSSKGNTNTLTPSRSRRTHKRGTPSSNNCDDSSSTQGQEMMDLSGRIPARPPGDAIPLPSEGGPTGRSSSQRDPDESTPVPEWLAEERLLPAQARRRAADPACYSAALSSSFGSNSAFSMPPNRRNSSTSSQYHTPSSQGEDETSSQGNDGEVELMHSRDEEAAVASLGAAARNAGLQQ
ncbi:hypothetical protein Efla_007095 [Eimeria flavescens]